MFLLVFIKKTLDTLVIKGVTMSYINIVLVVLIIIAVVLFFLRSEQKSVKKPAYVKKNEIIEGYKLQMQTLIQKYQDNEKLLKEEKTIFLKTVNQELNKNIFFTQEEIKKIIYELTLM
jgi:uncharacterized membrane protein YvbJ